jgi:regulator of replication initiation timing
MSEREGRSVVLSRLNIHHLSKRLDIAELMEAEPTKVHNPQTYLSGLDKTRRAGNIANVYTKGFNVVEGDIIYSQHHLIQCEMYQL